MNNPFVYNSTVEGRINELSRRIIPWRFPNLDGKPFYISGPNENLDQSNKIIRSLLRHCGEGNFDYLMSVTEQSEVE